MGLEIPWLAAEPETVPGFEGFEKRLEVEFSSDAKEKLGLRAISRGNIDRMLKAAECTIVAKLSNEEFDSYVLSESSLFVYPYKMVIKTCGTTKLLRTIPVLLELTAELGLAVKSCKYSRGTFFFPERQAFPHRNFSDEVSYLNRYFGNLGSGGRGYVLESPTSSHKWHVYVASTVDVRNLVNKPSFTMEMCMTELDREVASKFFKDRNSTALRMTESVGIDGIFPDAKICDFAFDPCGYSMNSVEGGAYSTIHVTPEEACSYASFETLGYGPENVDLKALLNKVLKCFKSGFFSVAIYATTGSMKGLGSWGYSVCPDGYSCVGSTRQELVNGEVVVYHTFRRLEGCEPDWMMDPEPLMAINNGGVELDAKKQWLCGTEIDELKILKMVQLVSHLARSVQPAA